MEFPRVLLAEDMPEMLETVTQLLRDDFEIVGYAQVPRRSWMNCRMLLALVSRIDSITSLPLPFCTAITVACRPLLARILLTGSSWI